MEYLPYHRMIDSCRYNYVCYKYKIAGAGCCCFSEMDVALHVGVGCGRPPCCPNLNPNP